MESLDPETLTLRLLSVSAPATMGAQSTAVLRIQDNDGAGTVRFSSVRFSSAMYNVNESSTGVTVTVIRGGSTGGTVTVNVRTTDTGTAEGGSSPCNPGIDFTTANQPVTFTPGETSKSVTIPLCPDTEVDGLETIGLALDNVVGATLGTPSTATIRIAENDVAGAAQFAAAASSVSETQGTANVLVTRTGGSASGFEVHWTITGGTAVHGGAPGPGVDYTGPTSGVSVFDLNQVSQSIQIPVWSRAGSQGPRSVTLVLDWAAGGGTLGARTTTTLWILDADLPESD